MNATLFQGKCDMNVREDEYQTQQEILARCFHPSGEWTMFPQTALDTSLVARFEAMVEHYPDRLAVWHEQTIHDYVLLWQ